MSEAEDLKIIRTVTVADDEGKPKRFEPGALPSGTSERVVDRIKRAGGFSERPMSHTGGARTLAESGVNPVTSTATAETKGDTESRDYEFGKAQGSAIEGASAPAESDGGKSVDDMTVPELREHAEANGIDLGDATRKDDILAAIKAA